MKAILAILVYVGSHALAATPVSGASDADTCLPGGCCSAGDACGCGCGCSTIDDQETGGDDADLVVCPCNRSPVPLTRHSPPRVEPPRTPTIYADFSPAWHPHQVIRAETWVSARAHGPPSEYCFLRSFIMLT